MRTLHQVQTVQVKGLREGPFCKKDFFFLIEPFSAHRCLLLCPRAPPPPHAHPSYYPFAEIKTTPSPLKRRRLFGCVQPPPAGVCVRVRVCCEKHLMFVQECFVCVFASAHVCVGRPCRARALVLARARVLVLALARVLARARVLAPRWFSAGLEKAVCAAETGGTGSVSFCSSRRHSQQQVRLLVELALKTSPTSLAHLNWAAEHISTFATSSFKPRAFARRYE